MNATTQRHADEQWAISAVLQEYRRRRTHGMRPYTASTEVVDATARYLADIVVDDGPHLDLAKIRYRAARAFHKELLRRMAMGDGRDFRQLTRTEQFWNTGEVTA